MRQRTATHHRRRWRGLTPVQRKAMLAWAARPNTPDCEIARTVHMKPAAFSRALQRALEAANLTRFMANVLRGGKPHTVRPLSLSGFSRNGQQHTILGV